MFKYDATVAINKIISQGFFFKLQSYIAHVKTLGTKLYITSSCMSECNSLNMDLVIQRVEDVSRNGSLKLSSFQSMCRGSSSGCSTLKTRGLLVLDSLECVTAAGIHSSSLRCSCHTDSFWWEQQNVLSCFDSVLH